MAEFLEAFMMVSFGISWPLAILKSYRARSAKGKSLLFLLFILFGYASGIASKLISGHLTYVLAFYVLNFLLVAVDLALYVRNTRLDSSPRA
jgi:hydrogenase/urease accessory protein HupE